MTTVNPQRQCPLFRKFSSEVRPPPLLRRDERIRSMTCSFEEIAESEEEGTQLSERTQAGGRSPFAVSLQSPFPQRRGNSPQNLSPTLQKKLVAPRLCRGFSDPAIRRKPSPTHMFNSMSPDRHDSVTDLLSLPPIPEAAAPSSSSPDLRDDSE
ncbi:hypothetical protein NECAME_16298 [Necator americanus]|uniref:Uncharacterized protein n=1 Tax=Necator americanus TaxID=51031 RepID=W2TWP3_NECAM|nr:hypothetical protein NECAME_16298 [Necator americanus]ETN86495.1 hypothetical protein NECAME_16298 [Necator americanus]